MVSSSGGFASMYPKFLGNYTVTDQTYYGNPVYKHSSDKKYLYFNSLSDWVLRDKLHPYLGDIYADESKDIPTRTGWKYRDQQGNYVSDPMMQLEAEVTTATTTTTTTSDETTTTTISTTTTTTITTPTTTTTTSDELTTTITTSTTSVTSVASNSIAMEVPDQFSSFLDYDSCLLPDSNLTKSAIKKLPFFD